MTWPLRLTRQLDGAPFVGRHKEYCAEVIEAKPAEGGDVEELTADPDETVQNDVWLDDNGWRYLFEGKAEA